MSWDISKTYRAVAGVSAMLWVISLACPAYVVAVEEDWSKLDYMPGIMILLIGWAGTLSATHDLLFEGKMPEWALFAWLANIALLWNFVRMARTKSPTHAVGVMGIAIAALALLPIRRESFFDDHGVNSEPTLQIGAYLWMAAFVPIVIMSIFVLIMRLLGRSSRGLNTTVIPGRAERGEGDPG